MGSLVDFQDYQCCSGHHKSHRVPAATASERQFGREFPPLDVENRSVG